jgi:defect in organelle trafficking protein DotC
MKKCTYFYLLCLLFPLCTLMSCSLLPKRTISSINTVNLGDLEQLSQTELIPDEPLVGKIRLDALKETAMTIGAQGGLAYRARQINEVLHSNEEHLSKTFNFNSLILDNNILPPVLQESSQSLQVNSDTALRTANHSYHILKQARFVTTPPTWRDYLWLRYSKPEVPDNTLLPRSNGERIIWMKYTRFGWQTGMKQADNIYADNLARIKSDFAGMLLYRKLLTQNMVTKPFVAKSNLGITSNDDRSEMRIDDTILRITAVPQLNENPKVWKPVLIHTEEE